MAKNDSTNSHDDTHLNPDQEAPLDAFAYILGGKASLLTPSGDAATPPVLEGDLADVVRLLRAQGDPEEILPQLREAVRTKDLRRIRDLLLETKEFFARRAA